MKKFVIFATALSLISTTSFAFIKYRHPKLTEITVGVIAGELVKHKVENIEYKLKEDLEEDKDKIENYKNNEAGSVIEPGKGEPPQVIYNPEPELATPTIPVNRHPGQIIERLNDHPKVEGKIETRIIDKVEKIEEPKDESAPTVTDKSHIPLWIEEWIYMISNKTSNDVAPQDTKQPQPSPNGEKWKTPGQDVPPPDGTFAPHWIPIIDAKN